MSGEGDTMRKHFWCADPAAAAAAVRAGLTEKIAEACEIAG